MKTDNDTTYELFNIVSSVKVSSKTLERVQVAKNYIEKKYQMKRKKEVENQKEWKQFINKLNELNIAVNEKELIKKEVQQKEAEVLRTG